MLALDSKNNSKKTKEVHSVNDIETDNSDS